MLDHLLASDRTHSSEEHEPFSKPKMFKCNKCDKAFRYRQSLGNHHRHQHQSKPKVFQCHLCSHEFKWMNQLSNHLDAVHNVSKEFECTICGHFFHQYGRAEQHMRKFHSSISGSIKSHPQFRR